jgi:hypothetical protein
VRAGPSFALGALSNGTTVECRPVIEPRPAEPTLADASFSSESTCGK